MKLIPVIIIQLIAIITLCFHLSFRVKEVDSQRKTINELKALILDQNAMIQKSIEAAKDANNTSEQFAKLIVQYRERRAVYNDCEAYKQEAQKYARLYGRCQGDSVSTHAKLRHAQQEIKSYYQNTYLK